MIILVPAGRASLAAGVLTVSGRRSVGPNVPCRRACLAMDQPRGRTPAGVATGGVAGVPSLPGQVLVTLVIESTHEQS